MGKLQPGVGKWLALFCSGRPWMTHTRIQVSWLQTRDLWVRTQQPKKTVTSSFLIPCTDSCKKVTGADRSEKREGFPAAGDTERGRNSVMYSDINESIISSVLASITNRASFPTEVASIASLMSCGRDMCLACLSCYRFPHKGQFEDSRQHAQRS